MSKEFKKYASKYGYYWKLVTWCYLVWALIMSAICAEKFGETWPIVLGMAMALVVIILIPTLMTKSYRKKLMADPSYPELVADFEKSVSILNGRARLGEIAIYVKRPKNILRYTEITQVYQYVRITNGIESERALKYVNKKGKHRYLCALKRRDESRNEMYQIVGAIVDKNPDVKVGYR